MSAIPQSHLLLTDKKAYHIDHKKNNNEAKIAINYNICVSLILSAVFAHLKENAQMKKTIADSIEKKLYNKLFTFKNGEKSFVKKITKISKKKKKSTADEQLLKILKKRNENYEVHKKIADNAWKEALGSVSEIRLSINHLFNGLVYRTDTKRYLKLSAKELLTVINGNVKPVVGYPFGSLRVANIILDRLQSEIDKYLKRTMDDKENYTHI